MKINSGDIFLGVVFSLVLGLIVALTNFTVCEWAQAANSGPRFGFASELKLANAREYNKQLREHAAEQKAEEARIRAGLAQRGMRNIRITYSPEGVRQVRAEFAPGVEFESVGF